jgi:hypothetical protein
MMKDERWKIKIVNTQLFINKKRNKKMMIYLLSDFSTCANVFWVLGCSSSYNEKIWVGLMYSHKGLSSMSDGFQAHSEYNKGKWVKA